jgi:hypothetical protein
MSGISPPRELRSVATLFTFTLRRITPGIYARQGSQPSGAD